LKKSDAEIQRGHLPDRILTLQKKDIIFCDGEVFSLDRDLLMGAKTTGVSISISSIYIVFFTKMQKMQAPTKKGFALMIFENTMFLKLCRALINSSDHRFRIDDFKAKS
jgi:hypothetical protein